MSLMNWEHEQEVKRKLASGWTWKLLPNDDVILVPPKPSSTVKKIDNKDFEGRIAEAEVKNMELLPMVVQDGKSEEKKEDEEKVSVIPDKKIRREVIRQARHTRRMSFRILQRVKNVESMVKNVESLLDKLIELSQMKKDDKGETLVLMTPQEKRKNLEKCKQLVYGRIHRAGWTVAELKKRGITVEDIQNGTPLPDE